MREQTEPKLSKWPFYVGDALLLGTAYFIYSQSRLPMSQWELALAVLCVATGALFSIIPFVLEYRVTARIAEAAALEGVVSQIQRIEEIAAHISAATGRWQDVQDGANKTAASANAIAERMSAELKSFTEFMEQANSSEKATLRLEVEKLHRAENEWLQVLVRMLDHTYALHQGAVRSGQHSLIQQVGNFQNACRDAARRVGLTPFAAAPDEPFNEQRHKAVDGNGQAPAGALISETIATGYTFQGRLLRPALVRIQANGASEAPGAAPGPQSED